MMKPTVCNGSVMSPYQMSRQISFMTQDRFYHSVGHSPYDPHSYYCSFYWGYSLISAGEVITSAERMDDLLEVMTGSRFGYDPDSPLWDDEPDDYDVDESQEWHDFDPDC